MLKRPILTRFIANRLFALVRSTGVLHEFEESVPPHLVENVDLLANLGCDEIEDKSARNCSYKELRNRLYETFLEKFPEQELFIPLYADVEITGVCNLACRHCLYPKKYKPELSYESICMILDNLKSLGCFIVNFTGGEMFVREDALSLVEAAKEKGFIVTLNSNGTLLTSQLAMQLRELDIDEVIISLYGTTPSTHEYVTGSDGSFERTLRGIQELLKCGIRSAVRFMLMEHNALELDKVAALFKGRQIEVRVSPLLYPALQQGQNDPTCLRVSDRTFEWVVANGYVQPFRRKKCIAGLLRCRVDCEGYLFACELMRTRDSNLAHESFHIGAQRPPLVGASLRDHVPEECCQCKLMNACMHCPGLAQLEDGEATGKSSEICRLARISAEANLRAK